MMLKTSIVFLMLLLNSVVGYAGQVIRLSPKESRSITNHALWTVKATCNVHGADGRGKILVSVVENNCIVNGRSLSKGQVTAIAVKKNGRLSVSAAPGTTVNLVNLSTDAVQAVCS